MKRSYLVALLLLAACTGHDVTPVDHCREFFAAYCAGQAACNPPEWEDRCLETAEEECLIFEGPLPEDPDRCVDLAAEAECNTFTPPLAACFDTYKS